MRTPVGSRVGAILGAEGDTVKLFGYGVYVGDEPVDPEAGGFNFGQCNPKIVLDNGDVVWGCESWWGPEEQVKEKVSRYSTVVTVSIKEIRQSATRAQSEGLPPERLAQAEANYAEIKTHYTDGEV
jgi:hypothetical protein